ncbi:NBR1-Ig-like domain-containing protein [Pelolinea submarina]|uniref:Ig-like domain-containing protein n=1 Tax=Pelolinea submarina TaxID=913107 RepID=A0A3E0A586_9CHLR|nr:NBR1-Ig-like domain-containing protein [Pelolinea submarina]REG05474.1 Ig-like domain-containing protein [Pelolinea submarina]
MKVNRWIILTVLGIVLCLALACTISFAGDQTANDTGDTIQLTMSALQQTQTALAPRETPQPEEQPTDTESVEELDQPTPTINPTPCNLSHWTGETIPDGTSMDAGDTFTKSWTLRNDGICDWTTDYQFVFVEGDRMGGASTQNLSSRIEPGESITLSVQLTAPDDDGEYRGVWRLRSDDGEKFGNYWVDIYVGEPPAPFAVTGVSFYMPHTTIDTACPNDINVKAEIRSSAAGKVTYKWKDSAGGSSSTKSYTFDDKGTKIVEYNVTAASTGDYWAKLYIDNPNHQWFGPINFHVNCTP